MKSNTYGNPARLAKFEKINTPSAVVEKPAYPRHQLPAAMALHGDNVFVGNGFTVQQAGACSEGIHTRHQLSTDTGLVPFDQSTDQTCFLLGKQSFANSLGEREILLERVLHLDDSAHSCLALLRVFIEKTLGRRINSQFYNMS